jgi:hypothetical protein
MDISLRAWLTAGVSLISLAAIGAMGGTVPARATLSTAAVTSYRVAGALLGVAATSPDNAWAVGDNGGSINDVAPIILRWNGAIWSRVTVSSVKHGELQGVAAVSADDAWAVGYSQNTAGEDVRAAVLHWNGRTWSRLTSLSFAGWELYYVVATATDVWAVGETTKLTSAVFLHMTGGRWHVVPAVQSRGLLAVVSIAMVTPNFGWAAGEGVPGEGLGILMRWNGSVWKQAPSPDDGLAIEAMASGAGGLVWAVGNVDHETSRACCEAASMLWDGKSWRQIAPIPGTLMFNAVTFIPDGTAWAVGPLITQPDASKFFIAHWTGSTWAQSASPSADYAFLNGVAATSARDAWAVGVQAASAGAPIYTLILHWNGNIWS